MKKFLFLSSKGFTLIELLVVITILGILVTLTLVTINPAEAQKKARDTQRLKDMATIQSIVEQYLSDNPGVVSLSPQDSSAAGSNSCTATGWLGKALGNVSVCAYANVIPVDPVNRNTQTTTSVSTPATANVNAYYYIRWGGTATSTYKICTYLESTSNKAKLTGDGEATANNVFAIFSSDAVVCPL